MQSQANTPDEYLQSLPIERKKYVEEIRNAILSNMDSKLEEGMSYGMLGYYVPLSVYPDGYHCSPDQPLPFINLANQKNYISLYHMGLYMNDLNEWFIKEYKDRVGKKPNMGKCCIRFKQLETIPYDLIGELTAKISVKEWINYYENNLQNKSKK